MLKPLTELPKGSKVKVVDIVAGKGLRDRLLQMGLTPGTVVEVVENSSGPIILSVRGVTIALGRGMASKVLVEELQT
ncbi:MAG: FeoA family protein [Sulfolobales archaeon]|jgi:ferrous iron transport protein A|nr:ferrous iron transport protein A [Desulfurococcaceae archaeon]